MLRSPTTRIVVGVTTIVLLAGVALARFVLAGGPRTYEAAGFSFEYPDGWEPIEGVEFPNAEQLGDSEVGDHTVGLDPDNWVTVFSTPVGVEVTSRNVDKVIPVARKLYAKTFEPAGVRFLQEAYSVREAGLPGIRQRVALKSPRGVQVEEEITTLYRGRTSYTVNCQNRPERATEISAGCERVFESLRVKP